MFLSPEEELTRWFLNTLDSGLRAQALEHLGQHPAPTDLVEQAVLWQACLRTTGGTRCALALLNLLTDLAANQAETTPPPQSANPKNPANMLCVEVPPECQFVGLNVVRRSEEEVLWEATVLCKLNGTSHVAIKDHPGSALRAACRAALSARPPRG